MPRLETHEALERRPGFIDTPDPDYPDSDGKPMAENSLQFQWIVAIQGTLDVLFGGDPNVFVAGDMLWYPVYGQPAVRQAPDIFVVFGRPKGHRGSYKQWQEADVAPQVVFEVLSPGNRRAELNRKFAFYETYGVEEYYLLDPDKGKSFGWSRVDNQLQPVPALNGWRSPRLRIRFECQGKEVLLWKPNGEPFLTYFEQSVRQYEAEQKQREAEQERREAELKQREAEQKQREAEQMQREAERIGLEAQAETTRLAAKLRALGIDPDAS